MIDLLEVASLVIEALDRANVRYTVGGSLAASFSGEPRASIDVDIVVDMAATQIAPFIKALGDEFYADVEALGRAVATKTSTNLIHHATGIKVDLFVAGLLLDVRQLERRRRVHVSADPDRYWFVHSPEDILLQKLLWYRQGGDVSDRQWRDALAIVIVQGPRLDRDYLNGTATAVGLDELLKRAYREADTDTV